MVQSGMEARGMTKKRIDEFAQRLAQLRKTRGLSQTELANVTKISRRMIAHYETRVKDIPPKKAIVLAKTLGVSVDQLLGTTPIKESVFIRNRRLAKKMKTVDDLPRSEQKKVMEYIDMVTERQPGKAESKKR
jgi:transcriptional regulator with XRE-family HTH domain